MNEMIATLRVAGPYGNTPEPAVIGEAREKLGYLLPTQTPGKLLQLLESMGIRHFASGSVEAYKKIEQADRSAAAVQAEADSRGLVFWAAVCVRFSAVVSVVVTGTLVILILTYLDPSREKGTFEIPWSLFLGLVILVAAGLAMRWRFTKKIWRLANSEAAHFRWQSDRIAGYQEPLPDQVLRLALEIRETCEKRPGCDCRLLDFHIETLKFHATARIAGDYSFWHGSRTADPFLVVSYSDGITSESYHIAVWDEENYRVAWADENKPGIPINITV